MNTSCSPAAIALGCPAVDHRLTRLHKLWVPKMKHFAHAIHHTAHSGNMIPEQAIYYLAAARRNASVVCETGFWQGISTHMWLFANAANVVHSFDLAFPAASVSKLRKEFGGSRLHLHRGSTRETLSHFKPNKRCDIVSIDASHLNWDPYSDLVALLPHMSCGAIVFFDDTFDDRAYNKSLDNDPSRATFYNACTRSYWRAVHEGLVHHVACESFGRWGWRWGWRLERFPKGFCVARAPPC